MPSTEPPVDEPLARFVRSYLQRVVNDRDVSAVDELVAPEYAGGGHGWPEDRDALRAFYTRQARDRPDWQIRVLQTVEVGSSVVVRAHAGALGARPALTWLAHYRVVDGRIREIQVLSVVPHA